MRRQTFGRIDGSMGYRNYPLPYGFGGYPSQYVGGYPTQYGSDDYGADREVSFSLYEIE